MRSIRLLPLACLLLPACYSSSDQHGEMIPIAGAPVVYWKLSTYDPPPFWPEGGDTTHLGAVRVDLGSGLASFVEGLDPDPFPCYDRHGRRFTMVAWHTTLGAVEVRRPGGQAYYLAADQSGGTIQNLTLVEDSGVVFAFWLWRPERDGGPFTLYRANADTGEIASFALPPLEGRPGVGRDTLSAQDRDTVFLTEQIEIDPARSRYRYLTRRGDLAEGGWGEPIEGSFAVIDRRGTLLERWGHSWLAGSRDDEDHRIEVVRDGKWRTVDLGLGGWAEPVFDTGYVRLYDRGREQFVFRSLQGKPEVRVPARPPAFRGKPEIR